MAKTVHTPDVDSYKMKELKIMVVGDGGSGKVSLASAKLIV
jgi:GTPase SAR1 family protein